MHNTLKQFYQAELTAAHKATLQGNFPQAFAHPERAHILSQRFALAHARYARGAGAAYSCTRSAALLAHLGACR